MPKAAGLDHHPRRLAAGERRGPIRPRVVINQSPASATRNAVPSETASARATVGGASVIAAQSRRSPAHSPDISSPAAQASRFFSRGGGPGGNLGPCMRFRTVLFDLDGTLIDHFAAIHRCHVYAMRKLGLREPTLAEVRAAVGGGLDEAIARLAGRRTSPLCCRSSASTGMQPT